MGKIVAIGGGELKDLDTLPIDKEIVRLTGKKHPKALFIPTASGEPDGYIETFNRVYGKRLGCKTDVLYLIKRKASRGEIEEKILSADLIYVGGGNTMKMLKFWRKTGVDSVLERAYRRGMVLSGLSAGAICWFRYGSSDFRRSKVLSRISALDFIHLTISPHHIREKGKRVPAIKNMMRTTPGIALALDDNAAIEIIDDGYRIISSRPRSNAHKVYYRQGKLHYELIPKTKEFSSLESLLRK